MKSLFVQGWHPRHHFDGYNEGLLVEGIFLKLIAEKTLPLEIFANKDEMFDFRVQLISYLIQLDLVYTTTQTHTHTHPSVVI